VDKRRNERALGEWREGPGVMRRVETEGEEGSEGEKRVERRRGAREGRGGAEAKRGV